MRHDHCVLKCWPVLWGFLLLLGALPILAQEAIPGLPAVVNGGKPVELKVYGLPPATGAYSISAKASVAVAQAFMRRYPNISLVPFSFIKVPAGGDLAIGADTDILMSMAAGTAPDVLMVNLRQSDTFIRQGFLLPLDEYVAVWQQAPGGQAELDRTLPTKELWNVVKRPRPDGKTHIWAVPPGLLVIALQYRKDVLRGAADRLIRMGLNPENPPKNWDELYQMCLQLADPSRMHIMKHTS